MGRLSICLQESIKGDAVKQYYYALGEVMAETILLSQESEDRAIKEEKDRKFKRGLVYTQDAIEEILPVLGKKLAADKVEAGLSREVEELAKVAVAGSSKAGMVEHMSPGFMSQHPYLTAAIAATIGSTAGLGIHKITNKKEEPYGKRKKGSR